MKFAKFAIASLICGLLSAQAVDRTQPPPATSPGPYKLPPVFETQLPNGLAVLLVDDARLPLATVRLAFACGNRRDPKDMPGLAAAVAEMLTQQTKKRGPIQIVEAVDDLGGSLNATSGADHIVINGSIDADNLPALIDIMADVARNAEFPEIDLKVYKQRRRQTLAQQHSQPAFVASEVFRKALFGDRPYAHIGPTAAALESMERKALLDYRDRWMVPNNAFLIMVGALPARPDTIKMITDAFGSWQQKALPEVTPAPPAAHERRLILVDRPGAMQVDVRTGQIAATQRDPDYFAEVAGSLILSHSKGEAAGPDIRTEPVAFDEAGIFASVMQVSNESAGEAIQVMMDRLNHMSTEPVSAQELAQAKGSATGGFLLRLETQAGLADELMVGKLQKLPANYLETWRPQFDSVKPEDVQAAAKKFMSTQDSVVVVVGDAAKIGPSLAKIGRFEVVKSVQ